jgi:RHH-type proline utilization regulon transcriptional repressor/proline dehydrogenase/delta 1-pyrroline-5-carboxylate dehydrogenase
VLFVQDDIADKVMTMLAGAMKELKVGNPACCPPTSAR